MSAVKSKSLLKFFAAVASAVIALFLFAAVSEAETDGDFEYEVNGSSAVLTRINSGGDVTIPDTLGGYPVERINYIADHSESGSIDHLYIPACVLQINERAFIDSDTAFVEVADDNPDYSSDASGALYDKSGSTLLFAAYHGDIDEYTVPSGVETIVHYAFYNQSGFIGRLNIPASVTSMDPFTWLIDRISVDPANAVYSSDDAGALLNADKTQLIRLFMGYSAKKYVIPDSVTDVRSDAFNSCLYLEDLTVPGSVKVYRGGAIYAQSLKRIEFLEGVETIGSNSVAEIHGLEECILPSTVKTIEDTAISGCHAMKKIVIPASVEYIGSSMAIGDNSALETIVFLGVPETVYPGSFRRDAALVNVVTAVSAERWEQAGMNGIFGESVVVSFDYRYTPGIAFDFTDGIATFAGNGEIPALAGGFYDWSGHESEASSLIIGDGISYIGEGFFDAFDNVVEILIEGDGTVLDEGSIAGRESLRSVIFTGAPTLSDGWLEVFDVDDGVRVFAPAGTDIGAPVDGMEPAYWSYSDGELRFDGDLAINVYDFLDVVAVISVRTGEVSEVRVSSLSFDNMTIYYHDSDGDRHVIPDNTLSDGTIRVFVNENGEETQISFNRLCLGIADGSITNFSFYTSDVKNGEPDPDEPDDPGDDNEDPQDTGDTNEEDHPQQTENDPAGVTIVEKIVTVVRKALRWIVTLINTLFRLLKSLGG